MSTRWSEPVVTADSLEVEQAQRIQAIRAAREVVEERPSAPAFASSGMSANAAYLIETAQWIYDGTLPRGLEVGL